MRIEGLPPDGARTRRLAGHHWTDLEELLATIADRIAEVGVAQINALGGKAKKPKPLKRPGRKTPTGKRMGSRGGRSVAEAKAFLDSLAAPPAEVTQLRDAVERNRNLTGRNAGVLRRIHDQL